MPIALPLHAGKGCQEHQVCGSTSTFSLCTCATLHLEIAPWLGKACGPAAGNRIRARGLDSNYCNNNAAAWKVHYAATQCCTTRTFSSAAEPGAFTPWLDGLRPYLINSCTVE